MNTRLSHTKNSTNMARSGSKLLSTSIALGVLLMAPFGTQAQAAAPLFTDPVVGTWNVVVDSWYCDTGVAISTGVQSIGLFNADGTRHETNATNPALRSPAYGNWHRVAKGKYEFAFKFYRFDANGVNIGSANIRHELFLSPDGTEYYSTGPAEIVNPAGVVVFTACSEATATRFE
jgi:hypothetical protein